LLRPVLALPLIGAYTVALGLPAIVFSLLGRAPAARWMTAIWARLVLRSLGVDVSVSGAERCPSGPAVYAANHTSVIDIPILFGFLPVDFRIIHKRSLYLVPVLGQYLYVSGHIGIHRGSAFRARRGLELAALRIRSGTSVVVFPEGTRSPEGAVGAFKRSIFLPALEAGVPVVPLSLVGVKEVARGGLNVRAGRVRLLVHAPIPTAGRDLEEAGALAEEVRAVVTTGCEAA
jgi:1-acyl-sn-glycerol-3-phosphate acyltransferase